ncbi:cell division protein ZipA [Gallaecimonas kandeliae]|uniref:cell division protein ZipA n=1 Tax=Gallaecimonas kandeliae TaxID=3029055 RepID=UPI00264A10E4|nr:cell division protein ZipA [Gallaecimonas kandeliae]WKE64291.1 cell division protein ZipA [Gallaecimonas kandeliae]
MDIALLVLGIVVIVGIFAHGLRTIRRQGQAKMKTKAIKPMPKVKDDKGFDDDGIGEVRVVARKRQEPKMEQMDLNLAESAQAAPAAAPAAAAVAEEVPAQAAEPELPSLQAVAEDIEPEPAPQQEAPAPQQVLVLHVVAREEEPVEGAELLPLLLTLGLKFGEMDIFHRHLEPSGRGPVLFSLANMVNPGTFDLDNMEQFSTKGLALFMTLPNEGDAMKAFAMMLSAAQKLAEEFGCQVLDGDRNLVTQQTVQHYQGQIREFTRRQLLAAGGH